LFQVGLSPLFFQLHLLGYWQRLQLFVVFFVLLTLELKQLLFLLLLDFLLFSDVGFSAHFLTFGFNLW
jgi:hypothetical protein